MMNKQSIVLVVLIVCVGTPQVNSFDLGGLLQTTGDAVRVIAKKAQAVVDNVPRIFSPEQLLEFGKQSIVGLPAEAVFETINQICSIGQLSKATVSEKKVNINNMNYILMTEQKKVTIPLLKSDLLWKHMLFNKSYNTVILVTGWTSNVKKQGQREVSDTMYNAYKARGGYNFVVIDTAEYVDTLYTWSAFNTNDLGQGLADGLKGLIKYVPLEKIHLIGHSLGAHIVGAAGRYFQYTTNKTIPRITGLDPANPCFKEGESLSGIQRGDADFVDIIHTNSKVLGKREPIGDADFYPNGIVSVQPGCLDPICSHKRAWELYAETVYPKTEKSLMAVKCNSLLSLTSGGCAGKQIPLGFACPKTAKGNYFLKTNSKSPFGLAS